MARSVSKHGIIHVHMTVMGSGALDPDVQADIDKASPL